jgi:iron complex outermembrane receptor protein
MRRSHFVSPLALAVASLLSARVTAADGAHVHPHDIPEIVVMADPLGDVESHLATPVTVLDAEHLARQSVRSIGEAVANELGVASSDFGAAVSRPVIRGLGGARVRVLEDGLGTMDVSTISADHGVATEPVLADQIEIFRGPAALLYGSGASGGLVNVVNQRIPTTRPERPQGGLYGHYDTAADGWLAAFKVDAAVAPHVVLHADGLERDSDDVDIPGYAEVSPDPDESPGTLENSAADSQSYAVGSSVVGERGFLGFSTAWYANRYGVPGAHQDHEEEGGAGTPVEAEEEAGGPTIDVEQIRYDVDGELVLDSRWLNSVSTRWGYADYEHDEVEPSGEVATRFSNEEIEGRVELVHAPLGAWDGALGLQYLSRDFSAVGEEAFVPPSDQDSVAVFLFEKADFGPTHVDAGLRYEHQDAEDVVTGLSAEHNLVSIAAGGSYEYLSGHRVGVAATRSQRGPTIEELFANGPHLASNTFEIGDPALGEETSANIDLFWRKSEGRLRYDFTLFYNHIEDFVYLAPSDRNGDGRADRVEPDFLATGAIVDENDALLLVDQRQQNADFWGFELAGEVTVLDDARGRVDLRLWSDYVDGELADGDQVPRLPPLRYGFDLNWARGPAYAGFSVQRVTDEDTPAPLETDTDGYTMVNLDVGYTWQVVAMADLTLFGRATNLADQTARRHVSIVKDLAPLPGIGGIVGLRARF